MGDVVEIKENENQEQEAIPVNVENQEPVEVPINVENGEPVEVPVNVENREQEVAPANEEEVAIPVDIDEEVITQQHQPEHKVFQSCPKLCKWVSHCDKAGLSVHIHRADP